MREYLGGKTDSTLPPWEEIESSVDIERFRFDLDRIDCDLKKSVQSWYKFKNIVLVLFLGLMFIIVLLLITLWLVTSISLTRMVFLNSFISHALFFTFSCFFLVFFLGCYYSLIVFGYKVIEYFFCKHYAHLLAVQTLVYLLCELHQNEALSNHQVRMLMIRRMNTFIRYIRVISLKNRSLVDQDNSLWINQHFKEIENFIRERQRWLTAPQSTTALELKNDFAYLLPIFILPRRNYSG